MQLNNILEVLIFDVWVIDLKDAFPQSSGNQYNLVSMDYMSKLVEAIALPWNESRVAIKFHKKHIFTRFVTPWEVISDRGKPLINNLVNNILAKYNFRDKVCTTYHPQTSGQVEV